MVRQNNSETVNELEQEILVRLSTLSNPNTSAIRRVRKEFSKRVAGAPAEVVVELALRLAEKRETVYRFVATELIHFHREAFRRLNSRLVRQLSLGMNSWADVDIFACFISGPAWREGLISDRLVKSWTHSSNRWLRRAALVSTVPLNSKARGGSGQTKRTIETCEQLVHDRDDMVVKALSWALRELAKRDAAAVRAFLASHQTVVAPRIVREVNNKLQTGLKNPRKRR
jgi:3-methyladenine DNA glycosylase AlkD